MLAVEGIADLLGLLQLGSGHSVSSHLALSARGKGFWWQGICESEIWNSNYTATVSFSFLLN
jgi:hypothetical protein